MPELPPLWVSPPPVGHNGGPVMEPRRPGRPTIRTAEVVDRVLSLLFDGVPLRAIGRTPGLPSCTTLDTWRRADPGFDRAVQFAQHEGYCGLAHQVVEEVDRLLATRGVKIARMVFNLRCQQLARMNPRFFGGRDMKF